MAKSKIYLKTSEQPLNYEELATKLYNIITLNKITDFPDSTSHKYKDYVLGLIFDTWTFITYPKIQTCLKENIAEHDNIIKDSEFTNSSNQKCLRYIEFKTEFMFVFDYEHIKEELRQYAKDNLECKVSEKDKEKLQRFQDKHLETIGPFLTNAEIDTDGKMEQSQKIRDSQVMDIIGDIFYTRAIKDKKGEITGTEDVAFNLWSGITYHTPDYWRDLLVNKNFWDAAELAISSAVFDVNEQKSLQARELAKRHFSPNLQEYAKSMTIFCEVLNKKTYKEGAVAIMDFFHNASKFIEGYTCQSKLMCMYNTKLREGRNGKTYRMELFRDWLRENGFVVQDGITLKTSKCININQYQHHFYVNDEYAFQDCDNEFMKRIHQNTEPTFPVYLMHKGDTSVRIKGMFYFGCRNGKVGSMGDVLSREAYWVRCSDAKYDDNRDKLTSIIGVRNKSETESEPGKQQDYKNTCSDVGFSEINYKNFYNSIIFNYNKEIDVLKKNRLSESENLSFANKLSISIHLVDALRILEHKPQLISFNRIMSELTIRNNKYYNTSKAKQEIHILYKWLKELHPNLIIGEKKNWNENQVNINPEFVNMVENQIMNQEIDIDTDLVNRAELYKYICGLLDIEPESSYLAYLKTL